MPKPEPRARSLRQLEGWREEIGLRLRKRVDETDSPAQSSAVRQPTIFPWSTECPLVVRSPVTNAPGPDSKS